MSKRTLLGHRLRQEWARVLLGARRAALCAAMASAWLGAWLLGVWLLGTLRVYTEEPADAGGGRSEAFSTAEVLPVAGGDAAAKEDSRARGPVVPRVPRAYALDGQPRTVGDPLACPAVELVEISGDAIALSPLARVAPPFAPRLRELERVIGELSLEFYGRRPAAVLVAASYDCRSVSGKNQRLSEHALGNAIDITGFQFPALAEQPAFEVRVDRHWNASGDALGTRHARFLRALTEALLARDVFRTLLGPSHPDHADHFHFDMAPEYYVDL